MFDRLHLPRRYGGSGSTGAGHCVSEKVGLLHYIETGALPFLLEGKDEGFPMKESDENSKQIMEMK